MKLKKYFALIFIFTVICCNLQAIALESNLGIKRVYISGDQVKVSGQLTPNAKFTVRAMREGSVGIETFRYFWQDSAKDDGSFLFEFGMIDIDASGNGTDGIYEVYVTNENGVIYGPGRFIYSLKELRDSIVSSINSAVSSDKLDTDILSAESNFNVLSSLGIFIEDYKSLSSADRLEICGAIMNKSENYTESALVKTFNDALAVVCIKSADSSAKVGELINKYNEMTLQFVTEDNKPYSSFSGNKPMLDWINEVIYVNKNAGSITGLRKVFCEAVALYYINNEPYAGMKALLESYANTLELTSDSNYQKYIQADKMAGVPYISKEIVKAAKNNPFKTKKELKDAIKNGVKSWEDYKEDQEDGRGGSTGGGKKNSSTSAVVSKPVPTSEPDKTVTYTDLKTSEWARVYIEELSKKGIVSGEGDNRFNPDGSVTREQAVKMFILAFNISDNGTQAEFDDVKKDDWFYKYINIANSRGLVNGISENLFGVGTDVTREDMCVMTYRLLLANGNQLPKVTQDLKFSDHEQINDYAKDSVYIMKELGVINGINENSFAPKEKLTRAQAAKIIYMLLYL